MTNDALVQAIATVLAAIITASVSSVVTSNKGVIAVSFLAGAFFGFATATLWNNMQNRFFQQEVVNLAQKGVVADVQVSSIFPAEDKNCYAGKKAVDGNIKGDSDNVWEKACSEWASDHEKEGAIIAIILTKKVHVDYIEIYDRPNNKDQILAGEIQFDNGTPLSVDALSNPGTLPVTIPVGKAIQRITFKITKVKETTLNIGVSEIRIMGPAD